jgi:tRNA(Ile)-lysidine synthase
MESVSCLARPLILDEVKPIFDELLAGPLALAVSGGPDSMALLHLVARWSKAISKSDEILVLTVDHGLRNDAAREAEFVKAQARELGLAHRTMTWAGPKPETRIQAVARTVRYCLLAQASGGATIVTAHHQDDVAETFLLRLCRGSGVRGLAAMNARSNWPLPRYDAPCNVQPPALVRPLLTFPKVRLIATLQELGRPWIEDSSNRNLMFERVVLRQAQPALAKVGLTNEMMALSARRLARASLAVELMVDEIASRCAVCHEGGFVSIDLATLMKAPEEVGVRLLERTLAACGGQAEPARLLQVEELFQTVQMVQRRHSRGAPAGEGKQTVTLSGCLIEISTAAKGQAGREMRFFRELSRGEPAPQEITPSTAIWWDRRFAVTTGVELECRTQIKALGRDTWRLLKTRHAGLQGWLPTPVAAALPSFWQDSKLVSVPQLASKVPTLAGPLVSGQPVLRASFGNKDMIFGPTR